MNGTERYLEEMARALRRSPLIDRVAVVVEGDAVPDGQWEVVHGNDLSPAHVALAERLQARCVLTCHVAGWQNIRQGWQTGRRGPVLRLGQIGKHIAMAWEQACGIRGANAVIAVSENGRRSLLVQAPWARGRIRVIENGVNPRTFSPGGKGRGYGLFVGRLEPVKCPQLAMAAFERLGLPLHIVGTGSMLEELRARAPRNVSFLGAADEATLVSEYRGASVLVVTSQSEGYPLVVLEALSVGTPVISTRSFIARQPVNGMIHWIDYGLFGTKPLSRKNETEAVADLEGAILALWHTKDEDFVAQSHRLLASAYSWDQRAATLTTLYQDVVADRNSAKI
jgi:glycosyltransferase involved in cell wall biosynthesis